MPLGPGGSVQGAARWPTSRFARNDGGGEDSPRQIDPSGKSLLIYGNLVKPRNKKYFAFPEGQISGIYRSIPSHSEGGGRRHGRWTGCGGR
jgi:hypothetical protein